jgi:hypothetical protein
VGGGGGGEGGVGGEEAEQGGHRRRRPRSSRHHVERSERVSSGVPQKQSGEAAREERLTGNHSSPVTTTPCRWQPRAMVWARPPSPPRRRRTGSGPRGPSTARFTPVAAVAGGRGALWPLAGREGCGRSGASEGVRRRGGDGATGVRRNERGRRFLRVSVITISIFMVVLYILFRFKLLV